MRIGIGASRLILTLCLYPWLASSQTPESAIEGQVYDGATKAGIAGARVRLQCRQDDPVFSTTDASGHFRFDGIQAAADCRVRAESPGYMSLGDGPGRTGGGSGTPPIPSSPVFRAFWELRRYGVIAGRVLGADGFPSAGTRIEIYLRLPKGAQRPPGLRPAPFEGGDFQYWPLMGGVGTDERGEFRIAPLAAGTYALCAYAQLSPGPGNDPNYRPTFYGNSITSSGATPIELAEGKEIHGIDIQLVRAVGVTVSGRVLGLPPGGEPRLSTGVAMWPEGENHPLSTSSATVTGGRFEVKNLLPGRYVLAAQTVKMERPGPPPATLGAERVVEVYDRDVGGVKLAMKPVRDIPGAVSFENGCEVKTLTVWIQEPGMGGSISADIGKDGTFVLRRVPPGVYGLGLNRAIVRVLSVVVGNRKVDTGAALVVDGKTAGPLRIRAACGLMQPQAKRKLP